jgi:hypothetical protein
MASVRASTIGLFLALASIPAILAGCHASGARSDARGDGPASGGGLTAETYCDGYVDVLAEAAARCYGYSREGFAHLNKGNCADFAARVAAGYVHVDVARASACLAALPAYETCPGEPEMPFPAACDGVVAGAVPLGGVCHDFDVSFLPGYECQGGAYCKRGPNGACAGTCTAFLARGAACDPAGPPDCTFPDSCDADTMKCAASAAPSKAGGSCAGAAQCEVGLFCDDGMVCRAPKPSGAPCTQDGECGYSPRCLGPDGAKTCTPLRQKGESCTPGHGDCAFFSTCADGRCSLDSAAVGAPCGNVKGDGEYVGCVDGSACDDKDPQPGVCRALKAAGDACTDPALWECGGRYGSCDATTLTCVACPL